MCPTSSNLSVTIMSTGRATVRRRKARLGDEKTMMVYLDKMNPGYIYQLDLKGVEAEDGSAVVNPLICYTLNRLTNGDDKAPHLVRK